MAFAKWFVGGLAGGILGCVIWVLVTYYLQIEVGYIAIGIGILTGLGVRMFSRYDGTPPTKTQAVLACVIAGVMVLAGKFMVISMTVDRQLAPQQAKDIASDEQRTNDAELAAEKARLEEFIDGLPDIEFEESELPMRLARNEAQRREEAGETLNWPQGKSPETAETEADMPPEIMQWAVEQVANMSPAEREEAIAREEKMLNALVEAMRKAARESQVELEEQDPASANENRQNVDEKIAFSDRFEIFMDSLDWFDLLWIGLAMAIAYQISKDDESNVPPSNI